MKVTLPTDTPPQNLQAAEIELSQLNESWRRQSQGFWILVPALFACLCAYLATDNDVPVMWIFFSVAALVSILAAFGLHPKGVIEQGNVSPLPDLVRERVAFLQGYIEAKRETTGLTCLEMPA